jgi:Tfp pilus assembly protein PilN
MLSSLKSFLRYGTTYCSIEIATNAAHEFYYKTLAKRSKNEFVDLNFEVSRSIPEVTKGLSKNQHYHLIINTEKVLIKESEIDKDDKATLAKAFPSLQLEDFYYEILRTRSKCFISICRKDYVHEIISLFKNQNVQILSFHLGYTSVNNIVPYLTEHTIILPTTEILVEENEIHSIQPKVNEEESYSLDDIEVNSKFLISLSGLFNYLTSSSQISKNSDEQNLLLRKNYFEKNFFKKGLGIGVAILLIIMLTNLVLFTSYFKKAGALREEVAVVQNQTALFQQKQESINEKEKIVNNLLFSGNSKSSFYINRITTSNPPSIRFNSIVFQPLTRTIRPDRKIDYTSNTIRVSGESTDKTAFSHWVENLEQLDWIETVTILSYGSNSKAVNSFEISLKNTIDDTKK